MIDFKLRYTAIEVYAVTLDEFTIIELLLHFSIILLNWMTNPRFFNIFLKFVLLFDFVLYSRYLRKCTNKLFCNYKQS